jgi:hypothetical protein
MRCVLKRSAVRFPIHASAQHNEIRAKPWNTNNWDLEVKYISVCNFVFVSDIYIYIYIYIYNSRALYTWDISSFGKYLSSGQLNFHCGFFYSPDLALLSLSGFPASCLSLHVTSPYRVVFSFAHCLWYLVTLWHFLSFAVLNEKYEDDFERRLRRKIGVKGNNAKFPVRISAGTPAIPIDICIVFLSPSKLMPAQYHKRGHGRFLSHYFLRIFY